MKPKFLKLPLENCCWFCNERHCDGTLNFKDGSEIPVHAVCARSHIKRLKIRQSTIITTSSEKQAILEQNYMGETSKTPILETVNEVQNG